MIAIYWAQRKLIQRRTRRSLRQCIGFLLRLPRLFLLVTKDRPRSTGSQTATGARLTQRGFQLGRLPRTIGALINFTATSLVAISRNTARNALRMERDTLSQTECCQC